MKFVDEAPIHVKAGDGGSGAVSFRREKFVPRGGPNGGNGGKGGSIWAEATENATTLLDYQYEPTHRARNGEPGRGSDQYGHDGADIVLKVPVGTLVKDADSGEVLFDLSTNGQKELLAKGGRGGMGNMHFATATRQAPRFAQPGEPGEEKDLVLELKLLADVGLLGFPNAGKSTLISRLSKARPKIADYPFTTLTPHLGVVAYKDHKSFVMADIPGIIEGASDGAGLGHQFLKHVERCRILIHMLDCSIEPDESDESIAEDASTAQEATAGDLDAEEAEERELLASLPDPSTVEEDGEDDEALDSDGEDAESEGAEESDSGETEDDDGLCEDGEGGYARCIEFTGEDEDLEDDGEDGDARSAPRRATSRSPMNDMAVLNRELALYSEKLASIPQIIAATKIDLPESRARAEAFAARMQETEGRKVFLISSATGEGVQELVDEVARLIFAAKDKDQKKK